MINPPQFLRLHRFLQDRKCQQSPRPSNPRTAVHHNRPHLPILLNMKIRQQLVQGLCFPGHSMVRPCQIMVLQHLSGLPRGPHLQSPYQMSGLLHLLQVFHRDRPGRHLASKRRPVHLALSLCNPHDSALLYAAEHEYTAGIAGPHHFPEIRNGVRQRALCGDIEIELAWDICP